MTTKWIRKHRSDSINAAEGGETVPPEADAEQPSNEMPALASAVHVDEIEREAVMLIERYGESDPSLTESEIVRAEIALGLTDPLSVLRQDVSALVSAVKSKAEAMRVYMDYNDSSWYGTVDRVTALVICEALVQICQTWQIEPLDLWKNYAAQAPAASA